MLPLIEARGRQTPIRAQCLNYMHGTVAVCANELYYASVKQWRTKMTFRADEAARIGLEEVLNYLVPRRKEFSEASRDRSKEVLLGIIDSLGPVVSGYPAWHPLVSSHADSQHDNCGCPVTRPDDRCGYNGLDHTRFFAHGFITCPYGDGQKVIDSVNDLPRHHLAAITAERLDVQLYNTGITPILVKCEWDVPLNDDKTIPLHIAMPLLLEMEIPCWRYAQVAETWETMRSYFLGAPHGSRSSLFVNQETGQGMKKVWEALINTGMFGPIKV